MGRLYRGLVTLAARMLGGIEVPADVIAGLGVEIQRIGVRIRFRADLQRLAGEPFQPGDQRRIAIELPPVVGQRLAGEGRSTAVSTWANGI